MESTSAVHTQYVAEIVIVVVAFMIVIAVSAALIVAFTRATRAALRAPDVVGDRPEGFRYSFTGYLATLISGPPSNSAGGAKSPRQESEEASELDPPG